ncbi:MAG: class I SAM-dependent methyltransferase [Candidatus Kapabacteria bacterium]|jgi:2-polyprenyl-3-methyl-5-hydroxy-6-metoxy-1,4-benzoquinol methylase|nr:class I SAM-dependent methyltransferase [Candidatus Kapabacteria bacterium]
MGIKEQMEEIYLTMSEKDIPWNIETPPALLKKIFDDRKLIQSKVLELGCGIGNYVAYLSATGIEATGVDISDAAIATARNNVESKGLSCNFRVADVLEEHPELWNRYDFVYDWELLHHIFPNDRGQYAKNVNRMLKPGGRYLSVCFSEESPQFGGKGKYRITPLGTELYFSSEVELESLFAGIFQIEELKTVEVQGKFSTHLAVYVMMRKK